MHGNRLAAHADIRGSHGAVDDAVLMEMQEPLRDVTGISESMPDRQVRVQAKCVLERVDKLATNKRKSVAVARDARKRGREVNRPGLVVRVKDYRTDRVVLDEGQIRQPGWKPSDD